MSFKDTSGTAVIDAVLTDVGRRRMANGTFKVVKFALGDDEIDYGLIGPSALTTNGLDVPISSSAMFEAYGSEAKNIQYALNTYETPNSLYFPILKVNDKALIAAEMSGSLNRHKKFKTMVVSEGGGPNVGLTGGTFQGEPSYYLAVNDETAEKLRDILTGIESFKFLEDRNYNGYKIIVESGMDTLPIDEFFEIDSAFTAGAGGGGGPPPPPGGMFGPPPPIPEGTSYFGLPTEISYASRVKYLVRRNFLDRYFLIMADERFIERIIGPSRECSRFMNFPDGTVDVNFQTTKESVPISYANQFEHYQTFLVDGVPNLVFDHERSDYPSTKISNLFGPKGTVTAIGLAIHPKLKVNSLGTRDYRYTKYGYTDQTLFGGSNKFDYIETMLNILGATTDSKVQIPVRLIRYSGT